MLKLEKRVYSSLSKLIAVISSASTVVQAVSVCFVPILIGLPFKMKRKPEGGLQTYTKVAEVARDF